MSSEYYYYVAFDSSTLDPQLLFSINILVTPNTTKMKPLYLHIVIAACLIQFLISSCDLFTFQDTNKVELGGLNELKETISTDGQIIADDSDSIMAPFVYRKWFGLTESQQPIDSLYLLKNRGGELIEKWAIKKLISYDKRLQRHEYLLSNGMYVYFECDHNLNFYISEFVDHPEKLRKDLKKGKYVWLADKPDNWE
ncbi:MAG: hypothetical protein Q8N05_03805 [Bacteroidota bacterium]|nr:hypothetical protein [Bacteroidota bacterium]